jgi:hypothetical protein
VTNPANAPTVAFMVWLRLQGVADSKPIRPAFYGDNFFSLLPGESRTIAIEYSTNINAAATKLIIDGWNVARQQYQGGVYTALPDIHPYIPQLTDLAQSKSVTASSYTSGHDPYYAVDPDTSTRWSSAYTNNQWIAVDLGAPRKFNEVELFWEVAYGSEYKIQATDNTNAWTDILHVTNGLGGDEIKTFPTVTNRFVRMYGIQRGTKWGFSLYDFGVYYVPSLPAEPTDLAAIAISTNQISLAWSDNATNETGFEIYRKGGTNYAYALVSTVSSNVTSHVDAGLTPGTLYYYEVRATNFDGSSTFTPEIGVSTLPMTVIPPVLRMSLISEGGFTLTWPSSPNDTLNLYSTTSLTPPVAWSLVTNDVINNNGTNTARVSVGANSEFFQLRGP